MLQPSVDQTITFNFSKHMYLLSLVKLTGTGTYNLQLLTNFFIIIQSGKLKNEKR